MSIIYDAKKVYGKTVPFYGNVPDECRGNIIKIKPFQEKFKEAKCGGW